MYTNRQINLAEAAQSESSEQNCWKVIVAHRLDSKSIIGVVSLDAKLIILSIVQRINIPSSASPSMTRSCSEGSLSGGKYIIFIHADLSLTLFESSFFSLAKSYSNGSRPPSVDKEVYMPVNQMKYAKCAAGAVAFQGRFA